MSSQQAESKKECKFCSSETMKELKINPDDQCAFQVYCEYYHCHDDKTTKEDFEESYQGEFGSEGEFCEHLFESCDDSYHALNDTLKKCIDWKSVWDYSVQYDYAFDQGYVFRGI